MTNPESFDARLAAARAAYARGRAGQPTEYPTRDDASESLGLRDRRRELYADKVWAFVEQGGASPSPVSPMPAALRAVTLEYAALVDAGTARGET